MGFSNHWKDNGAFRSLNHDGTIVMPWTKVKTLILTAPKATESMVCIFKVVSESSPSGFVKTPLLPTSCPPAMLQNMTCFTPHVTNFVSESGRNSATKILWLWPVVLASFKPKNEMITMSYIFNVDYIGCDCLIHSWYKCSTTKVCTQVVTYLQTSCNKNVYKPISEYVRTACSQLLWQVWNKLVITLLQGWWR